MDLRVKKTRDSIINAFLQLRAKKPLEKISVKELSELAKINKATFYLHYKDIYDLSSVLETELIENVINNIDFPETVISNPKFFICELANAFVSNKTLMDILFSDGRSDIFIDNIEKRLKTLVFNEYPQYKDDMTVNIVLTYSIKGGYHAFMGNLEYDMDKLLQVIGNISECVTKILL